MVHDTEQKPCQKQTVDQQPWTYGIEILHKAKYNYLKPAGIPE